MKIPPQYDFPWEKMGVEYEAVYASLDALDKYAQVMRSSMLTRFVDGVRETERIAAFEGINLARAALDHLEMTLLNAE